MAYVFICVLGGYFAIAGRITIGNVQAFIQYVNQFNRPITEVAQLSATIQQIMAAAERVFEFLDAEEQTVDVEDSEMDLSGVSGEVEFHNVSFSYDKEKPVIRNFSTRVEPGMQVAIVGPTGAGKTTIVNLLMRFYEPDSGYITIDGKPIREMKRSDVRKLFGMVLQDTWLFSGTIMNNLKYGAGKNIPDAEVKKAIKTVGIEHFIDSLPQGLNTVIDEDSDNVSAGEKQLLTIARAMVAEPPMMILDEATSNVDTRTEQMIQDAFSKLTKGRTSFVIAHRLSTIRNADLILVMKDGNIIEQGKHDELLALNGFYAELYNSQFSE
jgi:ATP-binding cassette subfamily B protein